MKLIYVAGPFRASSSWGIELNVRRAEALGLEVALAGAMPVIPHKNTQHFHGIGADGFWLEGALEIMRRCDAVIVVPNWEDSPGTQGEVREAEKRGQPVFFSLGELKKWLSIVEGS